MSLQIPRSIDDVWTIATTSVICVWGARVAGLLLPQGTISFLTHAYYGFEADYHDFPFGIQLDAIHAVTHMMWGAAGLYIGFFRTSWAVPYMVLFGVYYVTLSFFGTFTEYHFGLSLGERENTAHWTLGSLGLVTGLYGLWLQRREATP